jgi:hypothetical protein
MKPTAGMATLYMPRKRLSSPSREGREQEGVEHQRELARQHVARVDPTVELLEDVVISTCTTSLEAVSWRCPLAPHHFLEGVQERCPRQSSREALHWRQHHRPLAKALSGASQDIFPLVGREAC